MLEERLMKEVGANRRGLFCKIDRLSANRTTLLLFE
jgi:hypothetical protein